ncbi:MAG: radical SAM protein [Planctomyces sp.]|nr:radical SAM protein [Planctomyces sp.]
MEGGESSRLLFQLHERRFEQNRFVYPVVSRRSRGVSVGVNLNPDKICNFDCIYCQVNRTTPAEQTFVEMDRLLDELREICRVTQSGELFEHPKFAATPPHLRRFNDIAFSGDGEPTTYRNFDEIIAACAEVRAQFANPDVKMVLITNASMFHRPHVQRGLVILDQNHGEIWAKLDAGTEDYFKLIERTSIPFQQILDNLLLAALQRPIVIQSLFMKVHGEGPSDHEIMEFAGRLNHIISRGGKISLVQIYTVARTPAESWVTPLEQSAVERIASLVQTETALTATAFV